MLLFLFFFAGILASCAFGSTIQLTQDNNKLLTTQGTWFVLYYQPSATSFETSWDKLADSFKDWEGHGVRFGKVDCWKEGGDLCSGATDMIEVSVKGKIISTYQTDTQRSLGGIIQQHIVSSPMQGSVTLTNTAILAEIESSGYPWFVKYYAPWCGHCKNMAPIWATLASKEGLSINMAEVNCESHRDLCSSQKVAGLPTLKLYKDGFSFVYSGDRTLENFDSYLKRMTGPPTQSIDHTSLGSIYEHPVSLIYRHSVGDDLDAIKAVATKYMDSIPFYTTVDPNINAALGIDGVAAVLVKDGGAVRQHFTDRLTHTALEEWIGNNRYPLVTRISSGNANDVLKGDRLVALLLTPDDMTNAAFRSVARAWLTTTDAIPVIFAELNGHTWANYVKRVYNISRHQLPTLVVLDPQGKIYFDRDLNGDPFSTDRPDALIAALQQTDQLEGYSTIPAPTSGLERVKNFLNDYKMGLAIGLLVLFCVGFAIITTGSEDIVPTSAKNTKKD